MSNWHDSDDGFKRFSESHRKPKGGLVVRLSWATLEKFGVKVAAALGRRRDRKLERISEARRRARR